jgi:hypothetical protein
MASAKQSTIERLHKLYVDELTRQLREPEVDDNGKPLRPTAARLATIGNFLARSGAKAVDDSPAMRKLRIATADLPFKSEDYGKAVN